MPHGLGHMLGFDAHDMEALGEIYIGYSENIKRSDQFGLEYLRFALSFKPGHVVTVEPGCYFIPELIDKWKAISHNSDYINFDKVEEYRTFGGLRNEENFLITETGCELLGKLKPKSITEVAAEWAKGLV